MSEIKYTSDGKKVLVVGRLNADQMIVQEIFVSNGQEIPSGSNFVVSSLHDAPAESWKEKNLRELEARYEREKKSWENKIENMCESLSAAHKKAELRMRSLLAIASNAKHEQIETLIKFVAGEITHVFTDGYCPSILSVNDDKLFSRGGWNDKEIEHLKLITLFGSANGDLSFHLSSYSDGSGGSSVIHPATSYADALAIAQRVLNSKASAWLAGKGNCSFSEWEKIKGIVIPDAVKAKLAQNAAETRAKKIAALRAELATLEQQA